MDARFVSLLYLQACAGGKRTDGDKWRHSQFLAELRYSHAIVAGAIDSDEDGPGTADPKDVARLAKATGMEAGTLSADEWAAIQQAERERLAKITQ